MPNSTVNTWRPRLPPGFAIQVAQIARRKGISDERALLGVIQAGIAAMSGLAVVPVPTPAAPAPARETV